MGAPTGITFLGGDLPPGRTAADRVVGFMQSRTGKSFNVHFAKAHQEGGHFAHMENAQAVVDDIRSTFRHLRA